jgi:cysteine-rich repeat protein
MVALAALASTARAQQQSKAQQRCINTLNGAVRGVVSAQAKTNAVCLRYLDRAPLESCLAADPRGLTEKARLKATSTVASRCEGAPDFGFTSAATANTNAVANSIALFHDVFGKDLSIAALNGASDPDVAKCQRAAHKAYESLFRAHVEAFNDCKREGLTNGTIDSRGALAQCLSVMTQDASPQIKNTYVKLLKTFANPCVFQLLKQSFPGRCPSVNRGDCILSLAACRSCLLLNEVDDLGVSCGCLCGDEAVDPGEECDDGNVLDGDGCSSVCTNEPGS